MSEQAPEPRAPGGRAGGAARRPVLGVPLWGWGVILGAGLGAIILVRKLRGGSSSTATTQGVSSTQVPSDQQIGLTEYEQISSQLTGIEGTNQALLAAIKDLQGADSTDSSGGGGGGGGGGGDSDAAQDEAQQDKAQAADEEADETKGQERRENKRKRQPVGKAGGGSGPPPQRTVPPAKPPARRRPPRRVTVPPARPPARARRRAR